MSELQRAELGRLVHRGRRSCSVAFRARIILECAGGLSNAAVAAKLRTTGFTVGFWRNRFIAEGVAGLGDEARPGAPRQIGDEKVGQVVRLTLERKPNWNAVPHDYKRHGVTSLFAALDVATGSVLGKCYRRHRSVEFLNFLKEIDKDVPAGSELHVVLDNYGTHKTARVRKWLQKRPRYHLHFTPTHASWLNQVERWFALLTQRQINSGSHASVRELEAAIREFIMVHNQNPKPFIWNKTADQILASIARFASATLAAHRPAIYARNQ